MSCTCSSLLFSSNAFLAIDDFDLDLAVVNKKRYSKKECLIVSHAVLNNCESEQKQQIHTVIIVLMGLITFQRNCVKRADS